MFALKSKKVPLDTYITAERVPCVASKWVSREGICSIKRFHSIPRDVKHKQLPAMLVYQKRGDQYSPCFAVRSSSAHEGKIIIFKRFHCSLTKIIQLNRQLVKLIGKIEMCSI